MPGPDNIRGYKPLPRELLEAMDPMSKGWPPRLVLDPLTGGVKAAPTDAEEVHELAAAVRELLAELRAERTLRDSPLITGAAAMARFERLPLAHYQAPPERETRREPLIIDARWLTVAELSRLSLDEFREEWDKILRRERLENG